MNILPSIAFSMPNGQIYKAETGAVAAGLSTILVQSFNVPWYWAAPITLAATYFISYITVKKEASGGTTF